MRISEGFVYLWKDTKRNKFYLGSHFGSLDDGYVGSNNRFICAFKSRPETFKRRILEQHSNITSKDLLKKEEAWLQLIKVEELGNKYYNEKRVAAGGDIISGLSEERRNQHKEKSIAARKRGHSDWRKNNPEEVSRIAKARRACVKNPRGGSLPGDLNPAKRPEVREKLKIAALKREAKKREARLNETV